MTLLAPPRPVPGSAPRNGLPWKPYHYNGDGTDTLTPDIDAMPLELFSEPNHSHHPLAGPGEPQPHGTVAAYRRHRRRGEKPCEECREAENARCRVYNSTRRKPAAQVVHASANGYPRCGRPRARNVAGPGEEVTCGLCLAYTGGAA